MTLQEKAQKIQNIENLTPEMLLEKDAQGATLWHWCAIYGTMKHIDESFFTESALEERNKKGETVIQVAVGVGHAGQIPKHLLTERALNKTDNNGNTAWHSAANTGNIQKDIIPYTEKVFNIKNYEGETILHKAASFTGKFKDMAQGLLTVEAMNQKDNNDNTVWHIAAKNRTLAEIPKWLFTREVCEVFATKNTTSYKSKLKTKIQYTVWELAIKNGVLKDIPKQYITSDLLEMKNEKGETLFAENNAKYVNTVLENRINLEKFITKNPQHAKDIEHIDPRFELKEVTEDSLNFQFEGIAHQVIMNKDGVFMKDINHESFNKTVQFIEKNYRNIEQSLILPATSVVPVEVFTL